MYPVVQHSGVLIIVALNFNNLGVGSGPVAFKMLPISIMQLFFIIHWTVQFSNCPCSTKMTVTTLKRLDS